jgi:hypothetical protein
MAAKGIFANGKNWRYLSPGPMFVEMADVGMVQGGDGAGLALETLGELLFGEL